MPRSKQLGAERQDRLSMTMSRITLLDGRLIAEFNGLPSSASAVL
jgi:hypothetical protein